MGDFTDGSQSPTDLAASDSAITGEPGKVETNVDGVFADGEKTGFPVFDVTRDEFNQNMDFGRKRLRFKGGTPVQQYMRGTRYSQPFWIAHKNDKGERYVRKIK